jgi:hypothetical protein
MAHKVWTHSLSFNISCVNRRIFVVSLAVLLLLSASPPRGEVRHRSFFSKVTSFTSRGPLKLYSMRFKSLRRRFRCGVN